MLNRTSFGAAMLNTGRRIDAHKLAHIPDGLEANLRGLDFPAEHIRPLNLKNLCQSF